MTRRLRAAFVTLAVALGLAIALNPSADRHRAKIKAALSERSQLEAVLGVGALAAFVSSYHSIGLASYTRVGDRLMSVGLYGMVFVLD